MADSVEFEMIQWVQSLPADRRATAQMSYLSQRKEPGTALALSLLILLGLSGVGRIYIGQVGLGLAMLFLNWLTCGVWGLVDLFLIHNAALDHNRSVLQRLQAALNV